MKMPCHRRIVLLLTVLCLFPPAGQAKSADVQSPESNPALVMPLQYTGGHLFARVRGARMGSLLMEVDTGTQMTMVSWERVRAVSGLKGDDHRERLLGYGDGPMVRTLGHRKILLYYGNFAVFKGRALVLDRKHLRTPSAPKIDGILGWDFFSQWCVRLNYEAGTMSLYPRTDCPQPKHGSLHGKWTKAGVLLPSVLTLADGKQARGNLELDTGADLTIVLAPKFRRLVDSSKAEKVGSGSGVNGKFAGVAVSIAALNIGDGALTMQFHGTTAVVRRRGPGFRNWWMNLLGVPRPLRDGGIGNLLLDKLVLTFDPERKAVYAQPAEQSRADTK